MAVTQPRWLQPIRDLLTHATPTQRSILGLLLSMPFTLAFVISQNVGFYVERWHGSLSQPWVTSLTCYQLSVFIMQVGILVWLWPQRFEPTSQRRINRLITVTTTTILAAEAGFMGNLTYPTNLVIIGIIPIGCLLLDIQSVLWATILGVILITLNDVAIFAGLVPYAPAQVTSAVFGDGLRHGPEMLRSGIMYVNFIAYSLLFFLLFDQYEYHRHKLQLTARRDSLTGLDNRRAFDQALTVMVERAGTESSPLTLALLDADFFKEVNDTYGHKQGDEVLVFLAQLLRDNLRDSVDIAARIGGEEFALVLPETDWRGGQQLCERIRAALRAHEFQAGARRFQVTLSIGLVQANGLTAQQLLQAADQNLYQAKHRGRDRIVVSVGAKAEAAAAVSPG